MRQPGLTDGTVVVILMWLSCRELRRLDLHFSMFTESDGRRGKNNKKKLLNFFGEIHFFQHSIYVVVQELMLEGL